MNRIWLIGFLFMVSLLNSQVPYPDYYDNVPDYSRYSLREIRAYNELASHYGKNQIQIAYVEIPKNNQEASSKLPKLGDIVTQQPRARQKYRGGEITVYCTVSANSSNAEFCYVPHPGKYWDFAQDQKLFFAYGLNTTIKSHIDTTESLSLLSARFDQKNSGYPITYMHPEPGKIIRKSGTVNIEYAIPASVDELFSRQTIESEILNTLTENDSIQNQLLDAIKSRGLGMIRSQDESTRFQLWSLILLVSMISLMLFSQFTSKKFMKHITRISTNRVPLDTSILVKSLEQIIDGKLENQTCKLDTHLEKHFKAFALHAQPVIEYIPSDNFSIQCTQLYHINYELFYSYYDPIFVTSVDNKHLKRVAKSALIVVQNESTVLLFPYKLSYLLHSLSREQIISYFQMTTSYEGTWVIRPATLTKQNEEFVFLKKGIINEG